MNGFRDAAHGDRPPAPGELFAGRFLLREEIARGGMGRVFAAEDSKLGRRVAVKFIASAVPDAVALRRFEQEARSLGAVTHPNILTIYDVGHHDGRPYLVV